MTTSTNEPIDGEAKGARMMSAVTTVLAELTDVGLGKSDVARFLAAQALHAADFDRDTLMSIRDLADDHLAACLNEVSTDDERSDRAHDVVDLAVLDLREIGFEGVAPWRMMAWKGIEGIRAEVGASEAVDDLMRLRDMIDKHVTELASGVPQ